MNSTQPFEFKEVVARDVYVDPFAQDVIHDPTKVLLVVDKSISPFSRSSKYHGRSLEDPEQLVMQTNPIADEFGHTYTAFSIKGAEIHTPDTAFEDIQPNHVKVMGMLDASVFDRCQKVSEMLRRGGVLTEWPFFHARPKTFPGNEEDMGLLTFKRKIFDQYLEDERRNAADNNFRIVEGIGRAGAVAAGLIDMQFGVMYRAMLCNARLCELKEFAKTGQISSYVSQAIKALQTRRPTDFFIWEKLAALDPESSFDKWVYLSEVLPSIMGQNLAKFHNTSSYHKYLHDGNWTLGGEIVDLDTVRNGNLFPGEEMEVTIENRVADLTMTSITIGELSSMVNLPFSDLLAIYLGSYVKERLPHENTSVVERAIIDSHFNPDSTDLEAPYLLDPSSDRDLFVLFMRAVKQATQKQKEVFDGIEGVVFTTEGDEFWNYANQQIDKHLNDAGFDLLPDWFDRNVLFGRELAKLISQVTQYKNESVA